MPRTANVCAARAFYHAACGGARKEPLFVQEEDFAGFLETLDAGLIRFEARLVAYCVMRTTWHLLIGPFGNRRLAELVEWVSATHSVRWRKVRGVGEGIPVYEQSAITTRLADIAALVPMSRYVERCPKSAGLVARAEDWPWSSLSQRRGVSRIVGLTPAAFLASDAWVEYVNAPITRDEQVRDAWSRRRRQRASPAVARRRTVGRLAARGDDLSTDASRQTGTSVD